MLGQVLGIVIHAHDQFFLGEMPAVRAFQMDRVGHAAAVDIIIVLAVKQLDVAGIEIMDASIFHKSAAGVDPMGIQIAVREQEWLLFLIADEITGRHMCPQLQVAIGIKRIILIIEMIEAVKLTQAVGIIEPADVWHQMIVQAARIGCSFLFRLVLQPFPCVIVFAADWFVFFKHLYPSLSSAQAVRCRRQCFP